MARAGNYDITTEQGSDFSLYLSYQENSGTGVTLDLYQAQMQVRRSAIDTGALLWISGSTLVNSSTSHVRSVTGGGSTGEFTPAGATGTLGTGGIRLDVSSAGASGTTGGILITVGADTMANVPVGKHIYDLEIHSGSSAEKIISGRFSVSREVTR
tara:strand:- start:57 stop:524 length:468 start_codon:yes stop_codon:yes gene_type:complete